MAYDIEDPDVWFDEEAFAEKIEYLPREGMPRATLAVINREPLQRIHEAAGVLPGIAPLIHLWIRKDLRLGVTNVDTGGDRVRICPRQGLDAKIMSVVEILDDSTPNLWHVKVR